MINTGHQPEDLALTICFSRAHRLSHTMNIYTGNCIFLSTENQDFLARRGLQDALPM